MEHDLYKNIEDIYMCTDFKILKVKVPIIFFGTEGFSARRDRTYLSLTLRVARHMTLLGLNDQRLNPDWLKLLA